MKRQNTFILRQFAGHSVIAVCWCFWGYAIPATAQLISPGKLARAHADLEGIAKCTGCHELGQRSAANDLCLDCHTPLRTRIEAGRGYHGTLADRNCADCHKEHFGADFILVRLDTLHFDHREADFELRGAHRESTCRGCHEPEKILASDVRSFKEQHGALAKTFLGLEASCVGCHKAESPHQDQFLDRECSDCHAEETWEEAPAFDHSKARFKLSGKHRNVACEGCHTSARTPSGVEVVRYTNLQFASCTSCHKDVHEGSFGASCASCHSPADWNRLRRDLSASGFDHATTGFSLAGAHARIDCAGCHARPARQDDEIRVTFLGDTSRNTYPRLASDNCLSCHVDFHRGQLRDVPGGGALCENCHGQQAWFPVSYDIERHNRESAFLLAGAHMATPCTGCHLRADETLNFSIEDTACQDCHGDDNPHGSQFVDAGVTICATCHDTDDWHASGSYDHDLTDFPLTGKHREASCESCHVAASPVSGEKVQVFRGLETTCESCHANDDPHQGQFAGATCDGCHSTETFTPSRFDHETTRFPLTGAHRQTDCQSCHPRETAPDRSLFARFRPTPGKCEDCHGE